MVDCVIQYLREALTQSQIRDLRRAVTQSTPNGTNKTDEWRSATIVNWMWPPRTWERKADEQDVTKVPVLAMINLLHLMGTRSSMEAWIQYLYDNKNQIWTDVREQALYCKRSRFNGWPRHDLYDMAVVWGDELRWRQDALQEARFAVSSHRSRLRSVRHIHLRG